MFWKLHDGLPKQGPGSDASTRYALGAVRDLPDAPRVLDLGCGTGRQTLVLARETGGHVTAVDIRQTFLDEVAEKAERAGLDEHIACLAVSMGELDFEPESFDLIWCESAIYSLGFAEGLALWKPLLRPGGALGVSEVCWLRDEAPAAVRKFWKEGYPAMQSHDANLAAIADAGYELLDSFVLPDADWEDGYYELLEPRLDELRAQCGTTGDHLVLDITRQEIDAFRNREGSFGYAFYVMRKRE